jgi:hypothetical protein
MEDDVTLKACPFCASTMISDYAKADLIWHPDHSSCPLSATYFDRANWNHRADLADERDKEIERLREALGGCEEYFLTLEEGGNGRYPGMLKIIRAGLHKDELPLDAARPDVVRPTLGREAVPLALAAAAIRALASQDKEMKG